MQYIDTGSRNPEESLGYWLNSIFDNSLVQMRIQSGYFSADSLGLFVPPLLNTITSGGIVRILIGSNQSTTIGNDVKELAKYLYLPQTNVELGVIYYPSALFHPKVYHFVRADESQCAYIGSSNFTFQGIASHNVEAGIILDTHAGDPIEQLNLISEKIDEWFLSEREGMFRIKQVEDVDILIREGILTEHRPAASPTSSNKHETDDADSRKYPTLKPLFKIPKLDTKTSSIGDRKEAEKYKPLARDTEIHRIFPDYIKFIPDPTSPSRNEDALSGSELPHPFIGLIFHLNNDSSRHFHGGPGTANISIPVESLHTLRFGITGKGKFPQRPRAEFTLQVKMITDSEVIPYRENLSTNIMAYGFLPGETGHGDIRMLVPAQIREFAEELNSRGLPLPRSGDLAALIWPTYHEPIFKLYLFDNRSVFFEKAREIFEDARRKGRIVGHGACWMPNDEFPE